MRWSVRPSLRVRRRGALLATSVGLTAAGATLALLPQPAHACGGTFCDAGTPTPMPVNQTGENILFEVKDGWVEAQVQIQYDGDPAQFGWIVPLMAEPEVTVGSEQLMLAALTATVPTYTQSTTQIFCRDDDREPPSLGCSDKSSDASFGANGGDDGFDTDGGGGEPEVVSRGSAGAFEYVVLEGGSVDGVVTWLDDNGYVQDPDAPPILSEYLDEGFMFLALKLRPAAGADELHPVSIRYRGDEPCIPIRLTRIAAEEDMGIRAFFLGDDRVVSSNFKHVVLNEFRIDLLVDGVSDNYEEAVTLAVDEAGGQAFVTEYAGTSTVLDPFAFEPFIFSTATFPDTPAQTLELLDDLLLMDCEAGSGGQCAYAHPQLQSLLNKYIPVPDGLIESDFYGRPDDHLDDFDLVAWDATLFATDVDERIVAPAQHAVELLGRSPYLTRLFTTMSPHEMMEDPLFVENRDLPDVANTHTSTLTRACRGRDFLTLDDGTEVTLEQDGSLPDSLASSPYALRVETCLPSGPPQVDTDNGEEIIGPAVDAQLEAHPVRTTREPPGEGCSVRARQSSLVSLAGLIALLGFRGRRRQRH